MLQQAQTFMVYLRLFVQKYFLPGTGFFSVVPPRSEAFFNLEDKIGLCY